MPIKKFFYNSDFCKILVNIIVQDFFLDTAHVTGKTTGKKYCRAFARDVRQA